MRFESVDRWTNLNGMRGLLFFAQRLCELTYPYTLDTHKSPTMSLGGLLNEALEIAIEASSYGTDRQSSALKSVSNIMEEFALRLRRSWIARRCMDIDVENILSTDFENMNISKCIQILYTLRADLDEELYIAEIIYEVINLSSAGNEKKKLDLLAREFVSTLQSRGVSRDHIYSCTIEFYFGSGEISDVSCVKQFCRVVYPHYHAYTVIFNTTARDFRHIDDESLSRRGIKLVNISHNGAEEYDENIEKDDLTAAFNQFRRKHKDQTYLYIKARATDYNSAVVEAKAAIDHAINFFKLFTHRSDIHIDSCALVQQACCQGDVKEVDIPQSHMYYIRYMRGEQGAKRYKLFSDLITIDVGPDRNKFENVVNIHGSSLVSTNTDMQLVNIWTCFETIAPSDGSTSNVGAVVSRVLPVLLLSYYERLVTNLLLDVIRWNKRNLILSMRKGHFDGSANLRGKFVELLCNYENEEALLDLFRRCGDFELLRNRMFFVLGLLKDGKAAKSRIDEHSKILRWQLHRIYRTRNRIVHAGESPKYTGYLLENAHDYFDLTLSFCMELSARKRGFDTFSSCLSYADRVYDLYYKQLESSDPFGKIWSFPSTKDKSFIFD